MTHDTSTGSGGPWGAQGGEGPWAAPGGWNGEGSGGAHHAAHAATPTASDTQPLAPTAEHGAWGGPPATGDPGHQGPEGHDGHGGHGAPPPGGPDGRRRRGSPGWPGVITAAVIAAVLSGGIAIGVAHELNSSSVGTPVTLSGSGSGSGTTGSTGSTAKVPSGAAVNWSTLAKKVEPSVVTIEVQSSTVEGEGTGIVLDTDGHVLTNNHVATAAGTNGQIRIILADGRVYKGTITGTDSQTDLAVLKIADAPSDLTPATFGDSSKVAVGEPVMAVGNPLGLSDTVTTGIVSATNRPVTTASSSSGSGSGGSGGSSDDPFGFGQGQSPQQTQSEEVVTNAIQTDAAINPGNSGGPLVNAAGQVIGINSSIASTSDSSSSSGSESGNIGLGFAIPSSEAKRVSSELLSSGKASHPLLGVTLQSSDGTATVDGTSYQAAIIAGVNSGGAADQAGLKKGDAIIKVDGVSVSGAESLTAQVKSRAPGDQVTLTVVRGGNASQVKVALGTASS